MRTVLNLLLAAGLLALVGAPAARADADKKPIVIDTPAQKAPAGAATIDFGGALGLSLDSLHTLGRRIDAARTACDPVSLAGLAKELGVAEDLSGKKAGLTAKQLTDEAVTMAKLRDRPAELRAVAKILGGDSADRLKAQADKVEKAIAEREKAAKAGERGRGIHGVLRVVNNSPYFVTIYVNFELRGTVRPFDSADTYVSDGLLDTTFLHAEAPGTDLEWSRSVPEPRLDATWTLTGS